MFWKIVTDLGKMSRKLLEIPDRPPWMEVKTFWSWPLTRLVSMRVTRDMVQELKVMGMASLSSRARIVLPGSGTSAAVFCRCLVRLWLKKR